MATVKDPRKLMQGDFEITPRVLSSVPAGSNGQIAVVTGQAGKRIYIREGGNLVPAIDTGSQLYNAERLDLVVDPIDGESPPSGTLITTQAEYDALGADLKYLQDVWRILPPYQGYYIDVLLKTGIHPEMPGGTGSPSYDGLIDVANDRSFYPKALESNDGSGDGLWSYWNPVVHFHGESDTEIEAAQAGTSTSTTIVRGSGSWTAHECQGQYAFIVTGPSAGSKCIIEDNTTNTLTLRKSLGATGSITFKITEPSAVCDSPNFGITLNSRGGLIYIFENIKFGTTASRFSYIQAPGTRVAIRDSILICADIAPGLSTESYLATLSNISFDNCYLEGSIYISGDMRLSGFSSIFTTVPDHSDDSVVQVGNDSFLYLNGCSIITKAGDTAYDGALFLIWGSGRVYLSGVNRIIGNGLVNGFKFNFPRNVTDINGAVQISNCLNAVHLNGTDVYLPAVSGSDNTTAFYMIGGANVKCSTFASLAATNELNIDGASHAYSEVVSVGDEIREVGGSNFLHI